MVYYEFEDDQGNRAEFDLGMPGGMEHPDGEAPEIGGYIERDGKRWRRLIPTLANIDVSPNVEPFIAWNVEFDHPDAPRTAKRGETIGGTEITSAEEGAPVFSGPKEYREFCAKNADREGTVRWDWDGRIRDNA
ncbi:MAG: hypothetical protein B7733_06400 [Myxococcales bacterium FL481]|nr:MAG: hypothetical protein B7733_06400 [Myxococcales bacterium FL481]